jgi:hypothetical protein
MLPNVLVEHRRKPVRIGLGRTLSERAVRSSPEPAGPMTSLVSAQPYDHDDDAVHASRTCDACGSASLTSGRLMTSGLDRVHMYACDACGDFWFEREGTRLTAVAMRELGLLTS